VRKVLHEENTVLAEGHSRLEEMKVELALLSDIATFPYYLGARVAGENLELRGYVPNDWVRGRAEELARRSTFLTVKNDLKIQRNLSTRPPLRPVAVLQKEGAELLLKNGNDAASPMRIDARPNGSIVVSGSIDSVESKLAISRLFRQLSGCSGVVNELVVRQVLRDGQRVIQVTKDGSMVVAPAALGQEAEQTTASPQVMPLPLTTTPTAPTPLREPTGSTAPIPQELPPPPRSEPAMLPPPRPTLPAPTPLPTRSLDAQDNELRLPSALPPKPSSTTPATTPQKVGTATDALTPPKLPIKWSRPDMSWESQMKMVEKLRTPTPAAEAKKANTALPSTIPFADTVSPSTKPSKSSQAKKGAHADFAEIHGASTPPMTWKRPGASEESEPKAPSVAKKGDGPRADPSPSAPLSSTSLHRWPPAYETRSPASTKGNPGVIIFDDDPAPTPTPTPAATGSSRPIVPADLQRRVKSACGWQARDVVVEMQHDGAVLVKVKVASSKVEDQLTKKILAIPEMTAPKVRLMMDVGP
jgi:hypothetical protein